MQIITNTTNPLNIKTDCLVLGMRDSSKPSGIVKKLDTSSKGLIKSILKRGDFSARAGETLLLNHVPGSKAERVLLVGLGTGKTCSTREYRQILKATWAALFKTNAKDAVLNLQEAKVKDRDLGWTTHELAISIDDATYEFTKFKSKKSAPRKLKKLTLAVSDKKTLTNVKDHIKRGKATAAGMGLTKDLGHTPPNICNPSYLAKQATKLAKEYKKISAKSLSEAEMKKLGMGSFLSVSQGSDQPGKMVIMQYKGGKTTDAPVVIVGKGITFDTGGYCIKTRPGMYEMKYDMCGAATVFGVMKSCAELNLPINVVGIVAAAENMISGGASRPADMVKSMSGLTIEITNTDAEGRLVLCDAMTYAKRFKPSHMISVATLTGAAIVSLGHQNTALLTNHQATANELLSAGKKVGDPAWQLPLDDEYQDLLKSSWADMINAAFGPAAGTITSACFLSRFADFTNWAHLDIAGTSVIPGRQTRASGRPVPLLVQHLVDFARK